MLGVVVWSNDKRNKAVIWCEDHGSLAYLEGVANLASGAAWPVAGDLVELECALEGGLRVASNVKLVSQGAGSALPQALHQQVNKAGGNQASGTAKEDAPRLRLVSERYGENSVPNGRRAIAIAAG